MPGFAPTPAAALRTPDAGNAPSSANNAADPKRPFSLEGSLNPAQTALPPADAAANAADGDFPATVSEDSPEGRKRRSARRNSALSQLNTLSGREDPAALWDNGAPRDSRELIRIVPPGRGRLGTFLRYRRLQLSVANFYLGNRLRKQYQLLEDSRGESRRSPGAVRDLAGLFIEARTKGLAGRVYPLGLDILEGPALERDARALFDKFFDADEEARAEWNAYVATALISPRAKIPSQLKKALFVVLQDAAAVPKTELARFLRERRAGLEAQSDQFLPVDTQERVIYVGTFSKTIMPSMRVSYLVIPKALIGKFVETGEIVETGQPLLPQKILTAFLAEGHFFKHLKAMRPLYQQRRMMLYNALQQIYPGIFEFEQTDGGMHIVALLKKGTLDSKLANIWQEHKLMVFPLSAWYAGTSRRYGLIMGYTNVPSEQEALRLVSLPYKETMILLATS